MADRRDQNGRPPGRSRPNDPLTQEVRRLFRREDMPARLRRLERLEETAFSQPLEGNPERPPEGSPPPGDEAETGG